MPLIDFIWAYISNAFDVEVGVIAVMFLKGLALTVRLRPAAVKMVIIVVLTIGLTKAIDQQNIRLRMKSTCHLACMPIRNSSKLFYI